MCCWRHSKMGLKIGPEDMNDSRSIVRAAVEKKGEALTAISSG